MKSYSHWGMFHCWDTGLPPMVEQPKGWMHVDIGTPYPTPFAEMLLRQYPVTNYTLAEILTPHEDDLTLTIVK